MRRAKLATSSASALSRMARSRLPVVLSELPITRTRGLTFRNVPQALAERYVGNTLGQRILGRQMAGPFSQLPYFARGKLASSLRHPMVPATARPVVGQRPKTIVELASMFGNMKLAKNSRTSIPRSYSSASSASASLASSASISRPKGRAKRRAQSAPAKARRIKPASYVNGGARKMKAIRKTLMSR